MLQEKGKIPKQNRISNGTDHLNSLIRQYQTQEFFKGDTCTEDLIHQRAGNSHFLVIQ